MPSGCNVHDLIIRISMLRSIGTQQSEGKAVDVRIDWDRMKGAFNDLIL